MGTQDHLSFYMVILRQRHSYKETQGSIWLISIFRFDYT